MFLFVKQYVYLNLIIIIMHNGVNNFDVCLYTYSVLFNTYIPIYRYIYCNLTKYKCMVKIENFT